MFEKFENLKSVLYKIVFMILFFILAKSCVSDYVTGGDKDKISELQQMIDENTTIIASLSNEFTETKIAKVVKLYKFDYSFDLNGESYNGKITLNAVPNTNKLKLYYLKENPNIISADPFNDLKSENEKGKSISDLLVGILWGILSIIILISLVTKFKNKKSSEIPKEEAKKNITRKKAEIIESTKEVTEEERQKIELEKDRIRKEKENPNRFMPK